MTQFSTSFLQREHIITADGSSTLKLSALDEQYHSLHGAIQESTIVYIHNGFNFITKPDLKILEIGFGTGLNCLLTFTTNERLDNPKIIEYTGIEPYPIDKALLDQLNYKEIVKTKEDKDIFNQLHRFASAEKIQISKHFTLHKSFNNIQEFKSSNAYFDIIYFDAFGPAIQPEMWTIAIFEKMFQLLKTGGVLVTYCAKGQVKRNLKAAGFKVENLPGPPGKREITRALKE